MDHPITTRKHSHFWRKKYSSEISEEFLTNLRGIWSFTIRRHFVGNILGKSDEFSFVGNNRRNTDDSRGRLNDSGYRFGVYVFVRYSLENSDEFPTKCKKNCRKFVRNFRWIEKISWCGLPTRLQDHHDIY